MSERKLNTYLVKSGGDYHCLEAICYDFSGGNIIFRNKKGVVARFFNVDWIRHNPDFNEISDKIQNIMIG